MLTEHVEAAGLSPSEAVLFVHTLAAIVEPVTIHFMWRLQLKDEDDELVLEAAINGRVQGIITFNQRDFQPAQARFDLSIFTPAEAIRRIMQ